MAGKRGASNDLNHDNWDQEDAPEEAGMFNRASDDVLKKRVFRTAKRRMPKSPEEGSLNVFNPANLAKFSSKPSQPASQVFGFLSKVESDVSKTNGISEKTDKLGDGDKPKTNLMFSFGSKPEMKTSLSISSTGNNGTEKSEVKSSTPVFGFGNFSAGSETKSEVTNTAPTFSFGSQSTDKLVTKSSPMFSFGNKQENKDVSSVKASNSLDDYYAKVKGLNQSVAKWINKHVESNPLINLQPIFKDYEKFFEEIEKERNNFEQTSKPKTVESTSQSSVTPIGNEKGAQSFSFIAKSTGSENKVELPASAATFKFGATNTSNDNVSTSDSPPKLSFASSTASSGFGSFSFGASSSAPINFGSMPVASTVKTDENKDGEESDEPPKVEVKQVEEEGHIYTIRCKLFVKKDGNFVEKGVGSLFLKPIPESDKMQVIVRAHNSLGNVLCNFILSSNIPTQRMGKNNVMVVCIPTPDSQPPPVPVLIKVKTGEDADQLLQTLEKHKK